MSNALKTESGSRAQFARSSTAVKVRGISSKPELNGCAAVVAAPHRTGGGGLRFPVRLLSGSEAGTSMLLRPANLTVLSLKVAKAVVSAALAAEGEPRVNK